MKVPYYLCQEMGLLFRKCQYGYNPVAIFDEGKWHKAKETLWLHIPHKTKECTEEEAVMILFGRNEKIVSAGRGGKV